MKAFCERYLQNPGFRSSICKTPVSDSVHCETPVSNLSFAKPRFQTLPVAKPRFQTLLVAKPRFQVSAFAKPRFHRMGFAKPRFQTRRTKPRFHHAFQARSWKFVANPRLWFAKSLFREMPASSIIITFAKPRFRK